MISCMDNLAVLVNMRRVPFTLESDFCLHLVCLAYPLPLLALTIAPQTKSMHSFLVLPGGWNFCPSIMDWACKAASIVRCLRAHLQNFLVIAGLLLDARLTNVNVGNRKMQANYSREDNPNIKAESRYMSLTAK